MKQNFKKIAGHLIIVSLLFLADVKILSLIGIKGPMAIIAGDYLVHVFLFYIIRYSIIPFLFFQGKWMYWCLSIPLVSLLGFLLYSLVHGLWVCISLNESFPLPTIMFFVFSLLPVLIISVLASLSFYIMWSRQKEIEAVKAENFRQQALVDPHLIMNGLNALYELSLAGDPLLPDKLLLMSENLRFALSYKAENGLVSLKEEVDNLEQYIEMRRFIAGYRLHARLSTDFSTDTRRVLVPPAIMTALVDNMFKYGDLSDRDHPGLITVACDKKRFELHVHNRKKMRHQTGTGFGIPNTHFRLKQAFGKRYKLHIAETETAFEVNLIIKL